MCWSMNGFRTKRSQKEKSFICVKKINNQTKKSTCRKAALEFIQSSLKSE